MTAPAPAPPGGEGPHPTRPSRWRRWLSPWNLVTIAVLVWAAPRLAPHLGALVGVRSGGAVRPRFALSTLDGQRLTDDSLRQRVVLVNFWATWCLPCRVEMPALEVMYRRHREAGLVLLGLSVDRGGEPVVRDFVRSRGVSYPVAIVGREVEAAFGGVRGYPTSFLIGRDGVVRHAVIGPIAPASLELAVRRLLRERSSAPNGRADSVRATLPPTSP